MPNHFKVDLMMIAAVLASPEKFKEIAPEASWRISQCIFDEPRHKTIWEAITALHHNGIAPDALSVAEEMRARGTLAAAGGLVFLADPTGGWPAMDEASSKSHEAWEKGIETQAQARLDAMTGEPPEVGVQVGIMDGKPQRSVSQQLAGFVTEVDFERSTVQLLVGTDRLDLVLPSASYRAIEDLLALTAEGRPVRLTVKVSCLVEAADS